MPGPVAACAEVEYKFEGDITIFAGGKLETPGDLPVGTGTKAGFYRGVGTDGEAKDFGIKSTVSVSAGGRIAIEREEEWETSITTAFK